MSKLIFLLLLFSSFNLFSQQNFFNVPSSDMTQKGKLFFQEQANITNETESNTTVTYGITQRFECGFNINNFILKESQELPKNNRYQYTAVLANLQYALYTKNKFSYSLGSQCGVIPQTNVGCLYVYANTKYLSKNEKVKFIGGVYYANKGLSDFNNQFGLQFGTDIAIIPEKVYLTADCMTGKNKLSLIVGGFTYHINHHILLSAGGQLPYLNSKNQTGFVFELTIL